MSDNEGMVLELEEEKPKGETRKLEVGAETPKPRVRRAETTKLEPEPDTMLEVVTPSTHLGLSREELSWAAFAHASILITLLLGIVTGGVGAILGVIVPALIWYINKDKSEYVVDHARQATVFQLAGFVGLLALSIVGGLLVAVGWAVTIVLLIVLVGLILIPVMLIVSIVWPTAIVLLPIVQLVYGCYAAAEAYNGRPFRYYWIAEMIDRYQAQS